MKNNNYFDPVSETGNWNVAADYVKYKIMKLLYENDQYQISSTFGSADYLTELITTEEMKVIVRLSSIKRLLENLKLIIENTHFALRKDDKKKFDKFYKDLERIDSILPTVESFIMIDGRRKTTINEENFRIILKELIRIKKDLNEPLNNADLIFTKFEEFDPDKFKQKIMKEMSERP